MFKLGRMLEQSGIKKIGVSNIDKFKVGYENWQSKVQKSTKARQKYRPHSCYFRELLS